MTIDLTRQCSEWYTPSCAIESELCAISIELNPKIPKSLFETRMLLSTRRSMSAPSNGLVFTYFAEDHARLDQALAVALP